MSRLSARAASAVLLGVMLAGCDGSKTLAAIATPAPTAVATPAAPTAAPTPAPEKQSVLDNAPTPAPETEAELAANTADVIDLTAMSATMVYAQVYDMVMSPASYDGRTFTVTGQFISYIGNPDNPEGSPYYYTVSVADATACCQQGLEFVLPEGFRYPDDFPAEGDAITVTGDYLPYTENGAEYYHLVAQNWSPA